MLGLLHVKTIEEAIAFANSGRYGNMACVFTSSGAAARKFRSEVEAGNIGINIGVAAPLASFPFSGARESFFGDLHGQGRHAVEFFHANQGRDRALAEGVVPEVLERPKPSLFGSR